MHRRHLLLALASPILVTGLMGLPGCAGLGNPSVITLGEAELAALVARAFPLNRRVLEVLDLQLSAPRLRLQPDFNRVSVALTLRAHERLRGGNGRGRLVFDSALRYEPQDASVRLTQVRVQQVDFMPGSSAGPASAALDVLTAQPGPAYRIGRALAELALEDLAIYRLSADRQASLRQRGLQPGAVMVTARGVEITLASVAG
ncbi:MAG: hypothetical protein A3E25_14585 [Burkholderiales bacterium RIFCSPHIGHO2_12_FULL_69_20]|nr:MAG: hypothetical protein A3E25_14585 [Burkholderiales bacterium RIFCSPHIGHO2_12_FULL_69_20]